MRYRLEDANGIVVQEGDHSSPAMTMLWSDRGRRREFRVRELLRPNVSKGPIVVYREVAGEPQEDPQ